VIAQRRGSPSAPASMAFSSSLSRINKAFIRSGYKSDIMTAEPAFLYLGCAALLIAAVMLGLSPKVRAALFVAMILAATTGAPNQHIQRVQTQLFATAD